MNIRRAFIIIVPVFVVVFGGIGLWHAAPGFVAQMHLGRASDLAAEGHYRQAIQQYDTALAEKPDLAAAVYLYKASIYLAMHDYDSALTQCNQDLGLTSNPASAYVMRAKVYLSEGEYQRAVQDCNQALHLTSGPAIVDAHYVLGMAYLHLGNSKDAANDLHFFLVLATPGKALAPTYDTLAQLYGSNGQNELAIEDFSKAIHLDPGYVEAYYNRGVTYKSIGKTSEALSDFKKVLSLTSDTQLIDKADQQIRDLTGAG